MSHPDYASYFRAGRRVRLRGLTENDAEEAFANALGSPGRQVLQLGIKLPASVEAVRTELAKRAHCQDVDGVIVFAVEDEAGSYIGGVSTCVESNAASIALHGKLGFAEEGRRRRRFFLEGRFLDDVLFGLTSEESDASLAETS